MSCWRWLGNVLWINNTGIHTLKRQVPMSYGLTRQASTHCRDRYQQAGCRAHGGAQQRRQREAGKTWNEISWHASNWDTKRSAGVLCSSQSEESWWRWWWEWWCKWSLNHIFACVSASTSMVRLEVMRSFTRRTRMLNPTDISNTSPLHSHSPIGESFSSHSTLNNTLQLWLFHEICKSW